MIEVHMDKKRQLTMTIFWGSEIHNLRDAGLLEHLIDWRLLCQIYIPTRQRNPIANES